MTLLSAFLHHHLSARLVVTVQKGMLWISSYHYIDLFLRIKRNILIKYKSPACLRLHSSKCPFAERFIPKNIVLICKCSKKWHTSNAMMKDITFETRCSYSLRRGNHYRKLRKNNTETTTIRNYIMVYLMFIDNSNDFHVADQAFSCL